MTIISTTPTQVPAGLVHDDEVTATTLPVSTVSGSNFKTLLRVVTPAEPGDILDITGRARVTCELAYTCGVGYYPVDVRRRRRRSLRRIRCGPRSGRTTATTSGNRPPQTGTTCPCTSRTVYKVPATWPDRPPHDRRFRADAHSTAAVAGQAINVD